MPDQPAMNDPQPGDPITTAAVYRQGPSARVIRGTEYDEKALLRCTAADCEWTGPASEGNLNYSDDLFDVCCPRCDKMLLIVS